MKIKLVYSNTKTYNGIKAYSLNLFHDLNEVNKDTILQPLPKIEFVIHGKKVGGWTSQRLLSWSVGNADIVHSTSHWDLTPNTNVVTIHDLYPIIEPAYFRITNKARKFYSHMLKLTERKAKYIIVHGEHIRMQVRKYIPDTPIAIIPSKIFVQPPTSNPYPLLEIPDLLQWF